MSNFIRLNRRITDTAAPFVTLTPGVEGCTDRYIASRVQAAAGAAVSSWAASDVGSTLTQTPGGTGQVTLQEEGKLRFLRAPGGGGQGRLLGGAKGVFPFTMAAILRAPGAGVGAAGIVGVSGTAITRSSGGLWTATGGATLNSYVTAAGWTFVLLQVDASKNMLMRIDGVEVSGQTTLTPTPTSSSGIYFGPSTAQTADILELVYWPFAMSSTQRQSVHGFMRSQYSVLS